MKWTLTVERGDVASPRQIGLDDGIATIGRAPECTLVLADAQRGISRTQARIERRGGERVLIDVGSNPTLVNDRVIDGEARETALHDGDRLTIGVYTLAVAAIRETADSDDAGADDDGALDESVDRLPVEETIMTQREHAPSASPAALPATPEFEAPPPASLIPDDWDTPREPAAATREPGPAARGTGAFRADPLAAAPLLREPAHSGDHADRALLDALGAGPPLRDAPPQAAQAASRSFEHVSPEQAMEALPRARAADRRESAASSRAGNVKAEAPRRDDSMHGAATSGAARDAGRQAKAQACAASRTLAHESKPHEPGAHGTDPHAALIAGLGIDPDAVAHLPPAALAHLAGTLLRAATQGAMTTLRSRAMTKRESRMAMTMIEERDNNPLKFFPDADRALAQMLGARGHGYLPADEALRAAFRDIQAHELAMVAGMRAALGHAMERIDPAAIERSLEAPNRLDALIGNRRARLWQRFVQTWEQVARETGDDFQQRFGEPFGRAYQAQLDALAQPER